MYVNKLFHSYKSLKYVTKLDYGEIKLPLHVHVTKQIENDVDAHWKLQTGRLNTGNLKSSMLYFMSIFALKRILRP